MASDEIIIKLRVDDGELKLANASIDKQSAALNKNTGAKKSNEKQGKRNFAVEKSLYQTTVNSTKGFSKQAREMGGSSGLVAAYATLAANVFAATAAFSALQRAAQFEQLTRGLSELGHQSGRTLSVMAQGLRDVTGNAISAEESMRAAALGVSGGFGGEQLEGLAKIARGASITLGRSLPDAFDRLTRGAIKLEPEILDELGIMVRLDDAVENYGAQIGKAGSALTQMERRQAFMNAILEQGEAKFGEIAEAVEPDVYSQLGATFADLTKDIFQFFNKDVLLGFGGLNDIVKLLADNTVMLGGVMLLFGSTIAGKMIPALGNAARLAESFAERQLGLAAASKEAAAAQMATRTAMMGKGMEGVASGTYTALAAGLADSKNKMADMMKMQKSLNASIVHYQGILKTGNAAEVAAAKTKLGLLEAEKVSLTQLIAMEQGKGAAAIASSNATALANQQLKVSAAIISLTNKEMGIGATWTAVTAATNKYTGALAKNSIGLASNNILVRFNAKAMIFLKGQLFKATAALQIFKVGLLSMIAPLAILTIAAGAVFAIWKWKTQTKELEAYKKGLEEMQTLFDELPEKVEKYNAALGRGKDLAAAQIRAFEIQSGLITEMSEKLRVQIKLAKEANESRPGMSDVRFDADFFDRLNASQFATAFMEGTTSTLLDSWKDLAQKFADSGIAEDVNKSFLENMFMVKGSPELKTFMQLLHSGIPNQAEHMKKTLQNIAQDKTIDSAEKLAKALEEGVAGAAAKFGALGPAATEFASGIKEADKEASKFLTTFAKKTSVDAFALATTGAVKNLDNLREAASDAGEDVERVVGTALLDVGSKVASMLGPDFERVQKELRQAGRAMELAGKSIGDGSKEAKKVEELARNLSVFETEYRQLNKDLLETQRLIMSTKTAIDATNKSLKFVKKNYKDIVTLAGVSNKLEKQNLIYQQEMAKAKFKQLRATFDNFKITETNSQGKAVERLLSFEELMTMTLDEQRAIINQAGLDQQQFNNLRAGMLDMSLRDLEIRKAIDLQTSVALKEETEARQKLLKIEQDIMKQKLEEEKLDMRIRNFNTRFETGLDARQEADFKVKAAMQEALLAMQQADMEKALIDARADIQMIEMKNLNKQAEIINKMMQLTGDDKIQLLDTESAFAAIEASSALQKDAIDKNVDVLKKKVVVAMQEGALAMKGALESGDIGLFDAIEGLGGFMKDAKTAELAVKDSNEAIAKNFYSEALSGNTLPGDKKIQEETRAVRNAVLDLGINMDGIINKAAQDAAERADESYGPHDPRNNPYDRDFDAEFNQAVADSILAQTLAREMSGGNLTVTAKRQTPMNVVADPVIRGKEEGGGFTGENTEGGLNVEDIDKWRLAVNTLDLAFVELNKSLSEFGPAGEAMVNFREGMTSAMNATLNFMEASTKGEKLKATLGVIKGIGSMLTESANMAVANIDNLINAEKRRDGQSKQSLEKIKQMEAKKEQMARKAFEMKKKVAMAETVINTYAGAMAAYKQFAAWPPVAAAMAAMVVAFGAKQLSMISKQEYAGGSSNINGGGGTPSITVGKREDKVDVSKRANAGELAFLRGDRGVGTTANNFMPYNGAAGLRKGYASGGVIVGEQGPEMIQPLTGFNVVPNDALGGKPVNAHFTINAIDAQGVEEVLQEQQGNIISMIRKAANDHGEEFIESVNTDHLGGAPRSAGGIDY